MLSFLGHDKLSSSACLAQERKAVQLSIQQQVQQWPKESLGALCTQPCAACALHSRRNPSFPKAKAARLKRGPGPGSRQDRGNCLREEAGLGVGKETPEEDKWLG